MKTILALLSTTLILGLEFAPRAQDAHALAVDEAREKVTAFEATLRDTGDDERARLLRAYFAELEAPAHKVAALEMIGGRYVSLVPDALVDPLVEPLFTDESLAVRVAAVRAIRARTPWPWHGPSSSHAAEVLAVLAACEAAADAEATASVVADLGQLGADEYLVPLKRALRNADPGVRESAAHAFATWLAMQSRSLSPLVTDEAPGVRQSAVYAMGRTAPGMHEEDFATAIQDEDRRVREAVVRARGSWGHPSNLEHLVLALRDESPLVRGKAARALGELGAREHADDVAKLLEARDVITLRYALEALSYLGTEEDIPRVQRFLDHDDRQVRERAAEAVSRLERDGG